MKCSCGDEDCWFDLAEETERMLGVRLVADDAMMDLVRRKETRPIRDVQLPETP